MEIGKYVKVIEEDVIYPTYSFLFEKLGFKKTFINDTTNTTKDQVFEIFNIHENDIDKIYAIRSTTTDEELLIESVGVEFIDEELLIESVGVEFIDEELLIDSVGVEFIDKEQWVPVQSKRSIKFSFKFGNISRNGYRHFPILYFGYGSNGFGITIFGLTTTVKLW